MNSYYAYTFLTGIYIGGYTNFFSKVVISGLVLYIVHPDNFNPARFNPLYEQVYQKTYPYLSKVYSFAETTVTSTSAASTSATSPLPPLKLNIVK